MGRLLGEGSGLSPPLFRDVYSSIAIYRLGCHYILLISSYGYYSS